MTYQETEEQKKAAEDAQEAAREAFNGREARRHAERPKPTEEETKAYRREQTLKHAPRIVSYADHAVELMYRRAKGKARPMPTPWASINKAMNGGLWPGLHVAVGGTGEGKTQFVLQTALEAAQSGTPVLYVGLELGGDEVIPRLLSLLMAQDKGYRQKHGRRPPRWSDLYLGKSEADIDIAVDEYMPTLCNLDIHLEVAPPYGWSSPMLIDRALGIRDEYPEPDGAGSKPLFIVLDYLQVIAPETSASRQELRERIGQASYAGRAAARDLGAVVLMVSSMSRQGAKSLSSDSEQPWERPPRDFVDLGKESGEIEYSADSVLVLCRGEYQPSQSCTEMHLGITKLRAGIPSWQHLVFDGSRFETDDGFETRPKLAVDGTKRGRPKGIHTKHKKYPHLTDDD